MNYYVTIMSEKDNLGRQEFLLEWPDNNLGYYMNEKGLKGQIFYCILDEKIKSFREKEYNIIYKKLF